MMAGKLNDVCKSEKNCEFSALKTFCVNLIGEAGREKERLTWLLD